MVNVVAFDLDGTLLNDQKKVGDKDFRSLINLKKQGVLRVAATGRNLYSLKKVLPENFPMDYAVFSSGSGIYDWKRKKIINKWHISKKEILQVIQTIKPYNLNYTIHLPIPNNHHILLYDKHLESEDLQNYVNFYKSFSSNIDLNNLPQEATQLIVLLNSHTYLYEKFKNELLNLKTVLTTSPIDNKSLWMEVFNIKVSKANGLKWLLKELAINVPSIFAIGNDYNDIDLLEYSNHAFVVANAPKSLKESFQTTISNNQNAFTEAIKGLSFTNY